MLELIIGKGRQVRVCMQVMDMAATDTDLAVLALFLFFAPVSSRHIFFRQTVLLYVIWRKK